jgi:hypothetical protein
MLTIENLKTKLDEVNAKLAYLTALTKKTAISSVQLCIATTVNGKPCTNYGQEKYTWHCYSHRHKPPPQCNGLNSNKTQCTLLASKGALQCSSHLKGKVVTEFEYLIRWAISQTKFHTEDDTVAMTFKHRVERQRPKKHQLTDEKDGGGGGCNEKDDRHIIQGKILKKNTRRKVKDPKKSIIILPSGAS